MTITEIIVALEAATGPDRKLDAKILLAAYPGLGLKKGFGEGYYSSSGIHTAVEFYTDSIDAALTLVPDGWRKNVILDPDAADFPASVMIAHGFSHDQVFRGAGKSLPLALCIAALRAREVTP